MNRASPAPYLCDMYRFINLASALFLHSFHSKHVQCVRHTLPSHTSSSPPFKQNARNRTHAYGDSQLAQAGQGDDETKTGPDHTHFPFFESQRVKALSSPEIRHLSPESSNAKLVIWLIFAACSDERPGEEGSARSTASGKTLDGFSFPWD